MTGFFESLFFNHLNPLQYNSVLFILLFSIFYIFYFFAFKHVRLRNLFLLFFSLYFYYKVSGLFVLILILIATIDYFIGIWIFYLQSNAKKKILLFVSLAVNIGYLAYFKYSGFLLHTFGFNEIPAHSFMEKIVLPIGISYFVFKSLTYIFDIYRETIRQPESNYINYLLYVSFFPNILAGPISKARDLLPQLNSRLNLTDEQIGRGFFLIMTGIFKKVVLADFLAINFIDRVFDSPSFFSGFENLMAGYGALIQIYCDFSGYTDLVIGIALLLGFTLKPNFNKPFLAQNITEFWRRWHITLSGWMSDYLFYPLFYSFRKKKLVGAIMAVLITFFISGLWHGPNWTFVLWGFSHGFAMVFEAITRDVRIKILHKVNSFAYKIFSIFITLNYLALTIILFRSSSISNAFEMYERIVTHLNLNVISSWSRIYFYPLLVMVFAYLLHYTPMKWNQVLTLNFIKLHWTIKAIILFFVIIFIYQIYSSDSLPFVYLEF